MSKTFPKQIDKNFDVSISSILFFCIAFLRVSQRWELKITTKNILQKIVSKSFYQKIDKKSKTGFFSGFSFLTCLGVSR
jgi:hypothetical protein